MNTCSQYVVLCSFGTAAWWSDGRGAGVQAPPEEQYHFVHAGNLVAGQQTLAGRRTRVCSCFVCVHQDLWDTHITYAADGVGSIVERHFFFFVNGEVSRV